MKASKGSQREGDLDGWLSIHYIQLGSQRCCLVELSKVEQEDYLKDLICKLCLQLIKMREHEQ